MKDFVVCGNCGRQEFKYNGPYQPISCVCGQYVPVRLSTDEQATTEYARGAVSAFNLVKLELMEGELRQGYEDYQLGKATVAYL